MAPSTNFIALSNIVFPMKRYVLHNRNSYKKYPHLKYLTPLIQSEIFQYLPPRMKETHETR